MVSENAIARTAKALASKVGGNVKSVEWLKSFSGLTDTKLKPALKWLRMRKLVVRKPDGYTLTKIARDLVAKLIVLRSGDYLVELEAAGEGFTVDYSHMTRTLFKHYYECMAARLPGVRLGTLPEWHRQTYSVKTCFEKAAQDCLDLKANPLDFIQAQFTYFDRIAAFKGKPIMPKAYHLHGVNARTRYAEHLAAREERVSRQATAESRAHSSFTLEEQRLKGLARFNNVSEKTVLLRMPQHFTEKFLRKKGVWSKVKAKFRSAGDMAS